MPTSRSDRQRAMRRALSAVTAAPDMDFWIRFLECVALHESNFRPTAHNDTAKEVAASIALNKRNGTVSGIDFDTEAWGFGSKGLFQFLGAVIALRKGVLRFPKSQTHPDMGFRPGIAIAAAFDFARSLMGWNQYRGSWASLWVGWGNPSEMNQPAKIAAAAKSLEDLGEKLGYARGWALERPSSIPARTQSEMEAWAKAADFAYHDLDGGS